tara:strand:- start:31 stop:315 length:285 start_codon:yes stop_codon:yes gene_type:complete
MKDNNLIAEFMGFKQPHPEFPDTTYWYKELPNGRLETLAILNYHISWDWLMPVVDKCFQEEGKHYVINDALLTINIDEVYKEVVEFINQLNKES